MRNVLAIVTLTVMILSCSAPDGFVIKGKIEGKNDEKVSLMKFNDGNWLVEDSTRIVEGKFKLGGSVDLPEMRAILLGQKTVIAQFFAENGVIKINADADSIDNTQISGSKSNDEFTVFTDELKRLSKEANKMQQEFVKASASGDEESQQRTKIEFEAMIENQAVFTKNFIRENRSSTTAPFVALWQLSDHMASKNIDTLVAFFDPAIQNSIYIEQLKKKADENRKKADENRTLSIGNLAPDFTMNNQEGEPITLSSLRGKVVLIDFWASWCGPCRNENPKVVKLYNEYKNKGFDIIGVSLDKDKNSWVKAIRDDRLEWHHVSDLKFWNNEVAQLYKVKSIPHTILLDVEGKIIANNLRDDLLAQKLNEILSK